MVYNDHIYFVHEGCVGYSSSGVCLAPHAFISTGQSMSHDQAQSQESGQYTGGGANHTLHEEECRNLLQGESEAW